MKSAISSLCLFAFLLASASAAITYSGADFANLTVTSSTAAGQTATADLQLGGITVGSITASVTYGGGTNPYEDVLWATGPTFGATGFSQETPATSETADGSWSFSASANAGYQIDGVSLFSSGTNLSNPTYSNLNTDGVATVQDDNEGTATELLANVDDGDTIANGSSVVFNPGSLSTGWPTADHTQNWSYDSAGGSSISFQLQSGPVTNLTYESVRFDVAVSAVPPVPEPSAPLLAALALGGAALRRRRR